MKKEQLNELMLQALETELGGVQVYENALEVRRQRGPQRGMGEVPRADPEPRKIVLTVFEKLGLDPNEETPGREIVRHIGESLVKAMQMARKAGNPGGGPARGVRVRRVRRDQGPPELGADRRARREARRASAAKRSQEAHDEVEEQEDEHLYHTTGWCRELWIESLGTAGGAAASRRGEGSQDRDRRRARQAVARGNALGSVRHRFTTRTRLAGPRFFLSGAVLRRDGLRTRRPARRAARRRDGGRRRSSQRGDVVRQDSVGADADELAQPVGVADRPGDDAVERAAIARRRRSRATSRRNAIHARCPHPRLTSRAPVRGPDLGRAGKLEVGADANLPPARPAAAARDEGAHDLGLRGQQPKGQAGSSPGLDRALPAESTRASASAVWSAAELEVEQHVRKGGADPAPRREARRAWRSERLGRVAPSGALPPPDALT